MSERSSNLTRRKFMAVGSAAIAGPVLMNMAGMVKDAGAAEKKYDFIGEKSCDLVVLGGGGSGMIAAVRAAQMTGKKVIVLEKAASTGGAAQYAGTIRTFGRADRISAAYRSAPSPMNTADSPPEGICSSSRPTGPTRSSPSFSGPAAVMR